MLSYHSLHRLASSIRSEVERRLCPLFAGGVPFSPCLQVYCDTINFWHCVIKRSKGVTTGTTHLHWLAPRLDLWDQLHTPLNEAVEALRLSL